MTEIRRRDFVAGTAAALTLVGLRARAQDGWPNRPVHFIVPLAPGGAIDFIARQVGDALTRALGQQVVVENRTGAGGTHRHGRRDEEPAGRLHRADHQRQRGQRAAYHEPALRLHQGADAGLLSRAAAADSRRAFRRSVSTPWPSSSLREGKSRAGFCDLRRRQQPARAGEWFKREAGIKIDHVPYRGAGQAINDLIAAHVKVALLGPTALMPHYEAGTLRLLAQSAPHARRLLKEVPTFEEAGYKGLVLDAWYAAFVPKGTPPAIVARLNSRNEQVAEGRKTARDLHQGRGRAGRRHGGRLRQACARRLRKICAAGEGARHPRKLELSAATSLHCAGGRFAAA